MLIGGLSSVGGVQSMDADLAKLIFAPAEGLASRESTLTRGPMATAQQPQFAQSKHSLQQPSSVFSGEARISSAATDWVISTISVPSQKQASETCEVSSAVIANSTRSPVLLRSLSKKEE